MIKQKYSEYAVKGVHYLIKVAIQRVQFILLLAGGVSILSGIIILVALFMADDVPSSATASDISQSFSMRYNRESGWEITGDMSSLLPSAAIFITVGSVALFARRLIARSFSYLDTAGSGQESNKITVTRIKANDEVAAKK